MGSHADKSIFSNSALRYCSEYMKFFVHFVAPKKDNRDYSGIRSNNYWFFDRFPSMYRCDT